jgi:hypothetical protein
VWSEIEFNVQMFVRVQTAFKENQYNEWGTILLQKTQQMNMSQLMGICSLSQNSVKTSKSKSETASGIIITHVQQI